MDGRRRPLVARTLRDAALALFSLVLFASHVQAQVDLTLPECAPTHVDVPLLRALLAIELDGRTDAITIGPSLCDASATTIDIEVGGAHDTFAIAPGEGPRETARAAALAIAERVPHMPAAPAPAPALPPSFEAEPAEALAPPIAEPLETTIPLRLPATIGVGLDGRILPVHPSWALGLRVDLRASFDATWCIRGELSSTWTRASSGEGDIDAIVAAGLVMLGASVFRQDAIDLVLGGRFEAGVLASMGWQGGASAGAATLHPWMSAGGEANLSVWLDPSVALAFDLALSAVIYGTRLSSWPSGTQIDYSALSIDLGAGVRFAL